MAPEIEGTPALDGTEAPARRPRRRVVTGWRAWLADPRSTVLFALASVVVLGGGRRLLRARRARAAVDRLGDPDVRPEEVESAADHGRAGLMDLFRLLGTAPDAPVRDAAGRALARLWAGDELVAEEEKAIVRRGFSAAWNARRRYPRDLRGPIPIAVDFGVPFLDPDGPGVGPDRLEWSHRIMGAERAGLEVFSDWRAGPGRADFAIDPADLPGRGPHRLVLQAKVRTLGLTSPWELELPHTPFAIEFDPALAVGALLNLPDAGRAEAIGRAIRLEASESAGASPRFVDLDGDLVLRDPPSIRVATPLPADLAHALAIELEGIAGRFEAGSLVLSGQGSGAGQSSEAGTRTFPIGQLVGLPPGTIERPGTVRLRAILTASPELGWADPDVRSIWPGTIATDWAEARVIRR